MGTGLRQFVCPEDILTKDHLCEFLTNSLRWNLAVFVACDSAISGHNEM